MCIRDSHYADENGNHAMLGQQHFKLDSGTFADDFHIFDLEWDAQKISWSVDGIPYAEAGIQDEIYSEFHEEFFLLLQRQLQVSILLPKDTLFVWICWRMKRANWEETGLAWTTHHNKEFCTHSTQRLTK